MLALLVVFVLLGALVFAFTSNLSIVWRAGIAVAVCLIPSIALLVWILKVGDAPLPGATTVDPKEITSQQD